MSAANVVEILADPDTFDMAKELKEYVEKVLGQTAVIKYVDDDGKVVIIE
jgi:hypothetical protein